MKLYGILLSVLLFTGPAWSDIDYAYLRKTSFSGLDTVHLFIRNTTDKNIFVVKTYLNGLELTGMPNDYVIWYQTVPLTAAPGEVLDVMVKLRWPVKKNVETSVVLNNGERLSAVVEPKNCPLKFSYIGYAENLKKAYLYLENGGSESLTVDKIYCGTKEITGNCFISEPVIRPRAKILVVHTPEKPFKPEQRPVFKITTDQDATAEAVSKVYPYFPIMAFGNDPRPEMGFDPGKNELIPERNLEQPLFDPAEMLAGPLAFYHVYVDPACGDSTQFQMTGVNAKKVIEASRDCYLVNPQLPTVIHVCEYDKPRSYFIYAETTDIMAVNPYEIVLHKQAPENNARLVKMAKTACEPHPLWTIPEAFTCQGNRFPTPEEERIIVYSEIGEGSKGIWYFVYGGKDGYQASPPLDEEIRKINKELQGLRKYLAIGEPFRIAVVNDGKVMPYALLCGDEGIVLLLINNDHTSRFGPGEVPFTSVPKENLTVTVKIPAWLAIDKIREISWKGESEVAFREEDGKVEIPIPVLDITRQFLVQTRRK